jgi:hypothetical protein
VAFHGVDEMGMGGVVWGLGSTGLGRMGHFAGKMRWRQRFPLAWRKV